jgi:hypothetical protein
MPYDMLLAPQNAPRRVRSRTALEPYPQPRSALSSMNEVAPNGADDDWPIEPMLLVHQEQVETFRLIVAAFRRTLKALARPYAG